MGSHFLKEELYLKKSLWLKFREFFDLKHYEAVGLVIVLCTMLIAFVFCEINFNRSMKRITEQNLSESTTIIFEESTTEPTTEEKSATTLSSFYTSPPTKPTQPQKSISKTSSSSNSSFSSASAIAFYYDDGESVYITADEYYIICGIVMNETGYGSYEGCVAVAQSIRNQIIREKHKGNPYDIASIKKTYQEHYTKEPNELVRKAVNDVFYNHIVITKAPIIAWCNGTSSWHSKQIAVCSYDGNTFYALSNQDW